MAFAKNNPDDNEILTNKTVAASASSALADTTAIDTTDATDLHIHVLATYNAAATAGYRLKLFASYDDGTNYESYPFWQVNLPYTAADTTKYCSAKVPHSAKYIKPILTNLDTGQSVTATYIWYTLQTA